LAPTIPTPSAGPPPAGSILGWRPATEHRAEHGTDGQWHHTQTSEERRGGPHQLQALGEYEQRAAQRQTRHRSHPVRVRPWRSSILLVAGDEAGKWNTWYLQAIPLAEQRYEHYFKERTQDNDDQRRGLERHPHRTRRTRSVRREHRTSEWGLAPG
jgi:hypothetical protein